jgi:hypothetical protein
MVYVILRCAGGVYSEPVYRTDSAEDVERFLANKLGRWIEFCAPDGFTPSGQDEADEPFWNEAEPSPYFYSVETR